MSVDTHDEPLASATPAMAHIDVHPQYVKDCYACKIATVSFGRIPDGTRPGHTPAKKG